MLIITGTTSMLSIRTASSKIVTGCLQSFLNWRHYRLLKLLVTLHKLSLLWTYCHGMMYLMRRKCLQEKQHQHACWRWDVASEIQSFLFYKLTSKTVSNLKWSIDDCKLTCCLLNYDIYTSPSPFVFIEVTFIFRINNCVAELCDCVTVHCEYLAFYMSFDIVLVFFSCRELTRDLTVANVVPVFFSYCELTRDLTVANVVPVFFSRRELTRDLTVANVVPVFFCCRELTSEHDNIHLVNTVSFTTFH